MTSIDRSGQRDEGCESDNPAGSDAGLPADPSEASESMGARSTEWASADAAPADGEPADTASISADGGVETADPFAGLDGELADHLRTTLDSDIDLATVRALTAAATAAAARIGDVSFQAPRKELASIVGELGHLAAVCTAGQVVITAEADRDGVVSDSTCRSTTAWVRDCDWHLTVGAASQIAKSSRILRRPDLGVLGEAIRSADIPVSTAVTVETEFDKIVADLATDIDELPEVVRDHILTDFGGDLQATVLDKMVQHGAEYGSRAVTELRESFLAQYGTAGAFDEEQASKKNYIELSGARKRAGVYDYKLTLDAEGHSVLEAAINTLSAPQPDTDTGSASNSSESASCSKGNATGRASSSGGGDNSSGGGSSSSAGGGDNSSGGGGSSSSAGGGDNSSGGGGSSSSAGGGGEADRDTRSPARRRGEALIELCRRAVAADSLPASPKTVVYLNANLDNLQDLSGAAVVVGTPAAGTILSAETARRMMCEACTVIPVVTDTDGTVIGVAEEIRLYNRRVTRALWRRDLHCTFPGCDAPATWCDVHHLLHWIDGGLTTPAGAALLCPRHHTVVHRDKLAGRIIAGRVEWDLEPGSYTRMLATATGPAADQAKTRAKRRKNRQRQADNGTSQT